MGIDTYLVKSSKQRKKNTKLFPQQVFVVCGFLFVYLKAIQVLPQIIVFSGK